MAFMLLALAVIGVASAGTTTFTVPATIPSNAAKLDPAPVGISYEFFTFPSYHTNVSSTTQCEMNLQELSGTWPPIRIGGTTQDRADFDPNLSAYVSYKVSSEKDAPSTLKFGPSFLDLAGKYAGRVVLVKADPPLCLNRGHNNLQTTISAAKAAKQRLPNLLAIELGNEPEYFKKDGQAIAKGTWNAGTDASSQSTWQTAVGSAINSTSIIQSCNSLQAPPTWGAAELIQAWSATALSYTRTFSHHNYPGGSVSSLMSHTNVVKNIRSFASDISAAKKAGKEYVFGETNSATGGGAANVSPSFGAALWVANVALRATSQGIARLYFHHGTIGNCQYCWWGRSSVASPYYGAVFATAALGNGSYVSPLDKGDTAFAGYAVYGVDGNPSKVAVVNSGYFGGDGTQGGQTFVLDGLKGTEVRAKRLSADSAEARTDRGDSVSWGGQTFADGSCLPQGTETVERVEVKDGKATFTVGASEALLVYL